MVTVRKTEYFEPLKKNEINANNNIRYNHLLKNRATFLREMNRPQKINDPGIDHKPDDLINQIPKNDETEFLNNETPKHDETELKTIIHEAIYENRQIKMMEGLSKTESKQLIPEISKDIVDKILVNHIDYEQKNEVRIFLNNDILPETEVRISHENGRYQIEILTSSEYAYQTLQVQKDNLKNLLDLDLGRNVVLNLMHADPEKKQTQYLTKNRQNSKEYYKEHY